ncbi:MAG TPA: hypothetical protein VJ187_03345, partial [Nitrospirota bacterium]|nr:hypothetical protein [Nitrospirota bacterium]
MQEVLEKYTDKRAYILAPVDNPPLPPLEKGGKTASIPPFSKGGRGGFEDLLPRLVQQGFFRIKAGEEIFTIPGELPADIDARLSAGKVAIVIDRITIDPSIRGRIADSIEMAFKQTGGRVLIEVIEEGILQFDTGFKCHRCNIGFEKPTPLLFSFNHPVGACPACKGFGDILQYDEDLIVPDKHLTLSEGAIDPWTKPAYKWWYNEMISSANKH